VEAHCSKESASWRHVATAVILVSIGARTHAAEPPLKPAPPATARQALARARKQERYLFLLMYDKRDAAYNRLRKAALTAMKGMEKRGDFFELDANSPEGRKLRKKHGLEKDTPPILLAISPGGIMTRAYEAVWSPYHLESAMLSPGLATFVQALREVNVVVLAFTSPEFPDRRAVMAAASAFAADIEGGVKVIVVDPRDKAEADLVARCRLSSSIKQSHLFVVRHGYISAPLVSPKKGADLRKAYLGIVPPGCICVPNQ
jgi:hypothetical protein